MSIEIIFSHDDAFNKIYKPLSISFQKASKLFHFFLGKRFLISDPPLTFST